MRKRILSIALMSVMAVSSSAISFADNSGTGFISGYSDGTFKPENNMTRAEVAKIVSKAYGKKSKKAEFKDVPGGHWASEYIGALQDENIIQGYPDGTFRPENNITRAEYSKIIRLLSDKNFVESADFEDTGSHWAKKYIGELGHAGIVNGYGNGYFYPDNPINRAEAVVMMNRSLNNNEKKDTDNIENPFSDIDNKHWAYDEIILSLEDNSSEDKEEEETTQDNQETKENEADDKKTEENHEKENNSKVDSISYLRTEDDGKRVLFEVTGEKLRELKYENIEVKINSKKEYDYNFTAEMNGKYGILTVNVPVFEGEKMTVKIKDKETIHEGKTKKVVIENVELKEYDQIKITGKNLNLIEMYTILYDMEINDSNTEIKGNLVIPVFKDEFREIEASVQGEIFKTIVRGVKEKPVADKVEIIDDNSIKVSGKGMNFFNYDKYRKESSRNDDNPPKPIMPNKYWNYDDSLKLEKIYKSKNIIEMYDYVEVKSDSELIVHFFKPIFREEKNVFKFLDQSFDINGAAIKKDYYWDRNEYRYTKNFPYIENIELIDNNKLKFKGRNIESIGSGYYHRDNIIVSSDNDVSLVLKKPASFKKDLNIEKYENEFTVEIGTDLFKGEKLKYKLKNLNEDSDKEYVFDSTSNVEKERIDSIQIRRVKEQPEKAELAVETEYEDIIRNLYYNKEDNYNINLKNSEGIEIINYTYDYNENKMYFLLGSDKKITQNLILEVLGKDYIPEEVSVEEFKLYY